MKRMLIKSWTLGIFLLLLWPGMAQAASCQNNIPASNPDAAYIGHGDGTVTDTRTGLMWKQCAEGQSGSNCDPIVLFPFTMTWGDAVELAAFSTFAGYDDWRLPNIKELRSLSENCRTFPTINTNLFPNAPSGLFWSSSPSALDSRYSWYVSFNDGFTFANFRNTQYLVRFVRDAE